MATMDYRNKLGEKVPGNTTIIGSNLGWKTGGLVHWSWELGKKGLDYRKVREEAAGIGTLVHSRIEALLHKRPEPNEDWFWDGFIDDDPHDAETAVENAMEAFFKWQDGTKFEVTGSEVALICECFQFGTTLDHPGKTYDSKGNVERVILEIKTSKDVYPDFWIQLSAQAHAMQCNYGELPGCHLLHISKEHGGFDHFYRSKLDKAWEAFLHLRALHGLKKGIK